MKNPYEELPYIKSADLEKHVKHVVDTVQKSIKDSEKKLYKNGIDPFSALFDSLLNEVPLSEWLKLEKTRQSQKTLQNALGHFHQDVLGSMKGWDNMGTGGNVFDIKNDKKKIIAEVKNKYNTTKGNHKTAIYDDLNSRLKGDYKDYTAYYVEVIPKNKKAYDKPFTPPDNKTKKRRPLNDSIRVIDGKSFYAMASGDKVALSRIYKALPYIIAKVIGKNPASNVLKSNYGELFNRIY